MTTAVDRHRVVVLVLPGVSALEFGIAMQIFGADPHYEMTVCTDGQGGQVPSAGFTITASAGLDAMGVADTVIVPRYENVDVPPSSDVLAALRAAHARGTRLVSICTGAFALAAAGLLDGRPATTHWQYADQLRRRYPRIDVLPNQLYVDDGDILTSAGITAGVDLCLHLVRLDQGSAAANTRARFLVAPPRRTGGQAQFVDPIRADATGDRLAPLRDWMLENLADDLSIDVLATRAHISRRTLIRRFREEVGTSPMAWLTHARIDRARELLETTTMSVERIGRLTGLGAPASVRAAFHRQVGTSPREYRALFRHSG
ncbi:helix-turn-helix domain-containing protein [Actinoallomurus purpureus]|uniref:GlxA family transcriptional regulator n=1 Tax=Actinoallomurus purpureus TaxID=478114 RepID=UPI00209320FF|nr:helix-turn-helix domain-containing protein [Actinoallomurus purpureus]MCO6004307.1 helix-turn-helix domain-containing protein [Actinoallomurus purpureus]